VKEIATEIGKMIAHHRNEKGISQEVLADLAQIHRTYVSQIERGLKCPTIYVLLQISKALDIKLSEMIVELEKR
jgi:ribosome-binding protein aMBF1 (putative translation factor)